MSRRCLFIHLTLGVALGLDPVTLSGQDQIRVVSPNGRNTITYADGPGAHWLTNPIPVTVSRQNVTWTSRVRLELAPGGGQAIRIRAAR